MAIKVWEGRRGGRRGNKNSRRSRRTAFGLRQGKKVTVDGELIGFWSDNQPFAHRRGAEYSVYRTQDGKILIHRVRWSGWTTANDEGKIFLFPNLDAAAVRFSDVLKNAGVLH